jgi:hypothetical protein
MTKLSDTQLVILTAAAQRSGHLVLPLPSKLRGGAAAKAVRAMIARGLLSRTMPTRAIRSGTRMAAAAA